MLIYLLAAVALAYFLYRMDCDLTLMIHDKLFSSTSRLKGQTVWVVGASTGIGKHLAIRLAGLRCKLILTATSADKLQEVKDICKVAGQLSDDDVLLCPFDVSDEAEQKKALERVLQHFGRLDILVNNAGRIYFSEFAKDTPADDLSVFRVNTFANVNLARLAIRHWTQSGRHGQIVVTTSLAAYIHSPFMHIYGASKRALHEYYNAMRVELSRKKVSVTLVAPGPVDSDLYQKSLLTAENKLDAIHGANTLDTDRCVELMLVAIANRLTEVWISKNPALLAGYFFAYCPFAARAAFRLVMTDRVLALFKGRIMRT